MITLEKIDKTKHQIVCIKDFTTISGERIKRGDIGGIIDVHEFIIPHIVIDNSWVDCGIVVESYVRLVNSHIRCNIPNTLMCVEIEDTILDEFPTIINQNDETYKTIKIIPFKRKILTSDGITISDTGNINYREYNSVLDLRDPDDGIFIFLSYIFTNPDYFEYSNILIRSRHIEFINAVNFNFKETCNDNCKKSY